MPSADLLLARARAEAARAELRATVRELQFRLRPSSLASDAIDGIKRRSEEVADEAVDAVRRRPVTVAAVAGGIAALIGAGFYVKRRRRNEGESE